MDKIEEVMKGLECCSVGADREPSWDNLTARNCGKCPYNKPGIACTRALAYDALELLKAQDARWISADNRPPNQGRYLVYGLTNFVPDHIDQPNAYWEVKIAYWSNRFGWDCKVKYWMPLPEPPKEET